MVFPNTCRRPAPLWPDHLPVAAAIVDDVAPAVRPPAPIRLCIYECGLKEFHINKVIIAGQAHGVATQSVVRCLFINLSSVPRPSSSSRLLGDELDPLI
jgi:hypothetical protein